MVYVCSTNHSSVIKQSAYYSVYYRKHWTTIVLTAFVVVSCTFSLMFLVKLIEQCALVFGLFIEKKTK